MSRIGTKIFYIVVIFVTMFFGFKCQRKNEKKDFILKYFLLSFLIPWIVVAFTNIGSDYNNYYYIIKRLTWNNYNAFFDEEPVMNILFLILKMICNGNVHIVIFLIKTINIMLIYVSFYIIKDKVKIGYSIMAYLFLIYWPSFYLLTIALAVGIVVIAITLLIYKNKKITSLILILLAAQFHNSAYIFLPVFLVILLIKEEKKGFKKFIITILYIVALVLAVPIYNFFRYNVQGFHYLNYGNNTLEGSGIMVLVKYVPLIIFIYVIGNSKYSNLKIFNCMYVYVISSLLFNILSYKFTVIERMEFYMLPLFSHFIPTYFLESEEGKLSKRFVTTYIILFINLYLIFRGWLVFDQRTNSDAGIGLYRFFNPFK